MFVKRDEPATTDYRSAKDVHEESPGSIGKWQSLTATEGNLRESATETKLP